MIVHTYLVFACMETQLFVVKVTKLRGTLHQVFNIIGKLYVVRIDSICCPKLDLVWVDGVLCFLAL